jgi:hypothetical protein
MLKFLYDDDVIFPSAKHHRIHEINPFIFLGRKEILDGMLGANLVCFQVRFLFLLFFLFLMLNRL